MAWQLTHRFVGSPCERGAVLRLGSRGRWTRRRGRCPHDKGSGLGAALAEEVTAFLRSRGIDCQPAAGGNTWLWCLGGPDLYRRPFPYGFDDLDTSDTCVDLNLYVCDLHHAVSVELYPYDLIAERGGSSPDDPRHSESVELGDIEQVPAAVLDRLEPWLDEVVAWPV